MSEIGAPVTVAPQSCLLPSRPHAPQAGARQVRTPQCILGDSTRLGAEMPVFCTRHEVPIDLRMRMTASACSDCQHGVSIDVWLALVANPHRSSLAALPHSCGVFIVGGSLPLLNDICMSAGAAVPLRKRKRPVTSDSEASDDTPVPTAKQARQPRGTRPSRAAAVAAMGAGGGSESASDTVMEQEPGHDALSCHTGDSMDIKVSCRAVECSSYMSAGWNVSL